MNSRIAASTSPVDRLGQPEGRDRLDVQPLVRLEELERLEREGRPVRRRAGAAPAQHAAQRGHPAERLGGLEHPVAFDAAVDLGALPELVGEVHLVPAGDAARGHAGVEQLVGPVQQRVQRLGGVTLLERPVGQLGDVPGGRGALEAVAQREPRVSDVDLGDDVEGPATGERDAQLGERLQRAADARRRPADPLGDGLELAVVRRDQRQHAVGLAQVEPRKHDRVGDVSTRGGHEATVPPPVVRRPMPALPPSARSLTHPRVRSLTYSAAPWPSRAQVAARSGLATSQPTGYF